MKWLYDICLKVWRCLFRPVAVPRKSKRVNELPDELDPHSVYLVGEGENLWFAAMICPCACGATLHMNLLPDSRPRWKALEHEDGTITLEPSVWRKKDCRSHFFLRCGFIIWCASESTE